MFFDRYDAGDRLASKLQLYKDSDSVVIALPRGGVLVGHQIATALHLPLNIVITRKIGHPLNREVAVCAVTEDGQRVCGNGDYMFDKSWIKHETALAKEEALRRRHVFGVHPLIPIKGKTVIVADDGIATGLTMKAALLMIRAQKPKKIVLAIPVCPYEVYINLRKEVDEIVMLDESKEYRGSVGAYYTHFPEVFDDKVITCLQDAKLSYKRVSKHGQKHIH